MVKRQREKQYQSAREHRELSQQRSSHGINNKTVGRVQRCLPFAHCALALTPIEHPVCNTAGIMFDNASITPFVMQHQMDPTTGAPMTTRDLIQLNMERDDDDHGHWHCPVLQKALLDRTKVVAVVHTDKITGRKEGNVISYDAYQELNVKAKNYKDLITGEAFTKADVLVLNDPDNDDWNALRDINNFYHIMHARELKKRDGKNGHIQHSMTATRVMEQLHKNKTGQTHWAAATATPAPTTTAVSEETKHDVRPILARDVMGTQLTSTTGSGAASLTSTGVATATVNEERLATDEEILSAQLAVMRRRKRKGVVRLHIDDHVVTVELHCDIAPRTCVNFLGLAQAGAYQGTKFYRVIAGFMMQGGQTANNTSLWGTPFADECDARLQHAGRGIVSMANAGPHTNQSQFFITFKSCPHLDGKHTVFGKVLDGMSVLDRLEKVAVDRTTDEPVTPILLSRVEIVVDPAQEARDLEDARLDTILEQRRQATDKKKAAVGNKTSTADQHGESGATSGVGKYLLFGGVRPKSTDAATAGATNVRQNATAGVAAASSPAPVPFKKPKYGNFSAW